MSARALAMAAGLAACLFAAAERADACVCVQPTVSANEPAGRVFFLGDRSKPEPLPGATVRLFRPRTREIAAEATTVLAPPTSLISLTVPPPSIASST